MASTRHFPPSGAVVSPTSSALAPSVEQEIRERLAEATRMVQMQRRSLGVPATPISAAATQQPVVALHSTTEANGREIIGKTSGVSSILSAQEPASHAVNKTSYTPMARVSGVDRVASSLENEGPPRGLRSSVQTSSSNGPTEIEAPRVQYSSTENNRKGSPTISSGMKVANMKSAISQTKMTSSPPSPTEELMLPSREASLEEAEIGGIKLSLDTLPKPLESLVTSLEANIIRRYQVEGNGEEMHIEGFGEESFVASSDPGFDTASLSKKKASKRMSKENDAEEIQPASKKKRPYKRQSASTPEVDDPALNEDYVQIDGNNDGGFDDDEDDDLGDFEDTVPRRTTARSKAMAAKIERKVATEEQKQAPKRGRPKKKVSFETVSNDASFMRNQTGFNNNLSSSSSLSSLVAPTVPSVTAATLSAAVAASTILSETSTISTPAVSMIKASAKAAATAAAEAASSVRARMANPSPPSYSRCIRRRFSKTSTTTSTSSSISSVKITESEMEQMIRRVCNSVHMMQQVLWPQYSTLEGRSPPSAELASSYWNAISLVLTERGEKDALQTIAEIMEEVTLKKIAHTELMFEVAFWLAGHDRLVLGFDVFLPPKLSMANLLVFQKLVVSLVHMMDRTIASDRIRQRLVIQKAMDELADALMGTDENPQGFLGNWVQEEQRMSAKAHSTAQHPSANEDATVVQASLWIDLLVKRYGRTSAGGELCENICKALMELGRKNLSKEEVADLLAFIRAAVRKDEELKKGFETFAPLLFPVDSKA